MATSGNSVVHLGGGHVLFTGAITHTEGAAEETVAIKGYRVRMAWVSNKASDEKVGTTPCTFSESVSGITNTVTLHSLGTIAAGSYALLAVSRP